MEEFELPDEDYFAIQIAIQTTEGHEGGTCARALASVFQIADSRFENQACRIQTQKRGGCATHGLAYTDFMPMIDVASLSAEERLCLLEELWDSLSATPEAVPVMNAQREELDRRLDELDRDGPTGIPWEEVVRRIRSRTP